MHFLLKKIRMTVEKYVQFHVILSHKEEEMFLKDTKSSWKQVAVKDV